MECGKVNQARRYMCMTVVMAIIITGITISGMMAYATNEINNDEDSVALIEIPTASPAMGTTPAPSIGPAAISEPDAIVAPQPSSGSDTKAKPQPSPSEKAKPTASPTPVPEEDETTEDDGDDIAPRATARPKKPDKFELTSTVKKEDFANIPGKTNIGLCVYAYKAVENKWGYARGTVGETLTESLLSLLAKKNPVYYTPEKVETSHRWLGHQVADCSGLIRGYLYEKERGYSVSWREFGYVRFLNSDAYALNSSKTETNVMDAMPDLPGIILHRSGHVGIYVGNNMVIQAQSAKQGVTLSEFKAKDWWTWAYVPCIEYITEGVYNVGTHMISIGDSDDGWVTKDDGNLYFYDEDGNPCTGIRGIGLKEYYFDTLGVCVGEIDDKGIITVNERKYVYTNDDPLRGWQTYNGSLHYFDIDDGHMYFGGAYEIDGKSYLFDNDGAIITLKGYVYLNKTIYYSDEEGHPVKGYVNGILYGEDYTPYQGFLDNGGLKYYYEDGVPLNDGFLCVDGAWYYAQSNGTLKVGVFEHGNRNYIFDDDGQLLCAGGT